MCEASVGEYHQLYREHLWGHLWISTWVTTQFSLKHEEMCLTTFIFPAVAASKAQLRSVLFEHSVYWPFRLLGDAAGFMCLQPSTRMANANWDFAHFIARLCLVSTALAVLKSSSSLWFFLLHASSDVAPAEDLPARPDCPRGCPRHSDDNWATLPGSPPGNQNVNTQTLGGREKWHCWAR